MNSSEYKSDYLKDRILVSKNGKPFGQFKIKDQNTELVELMKSEISRGGGNPDQFNKIQLKYDGYID